MSEVASAQTITNKINRARRCRRFHPGGSPSRALLLPHTDKWQKCHYTMPLRSPCSPKIGKGINGPCPVPPTRHTTTTPTDGIRFTDGATKEKKKLRNFLEYDAVAYGPAYGHM
ncbi:hypothetical protein RND71_019578 [Anisodus tanguticus]|uniref:Uncharacterized protein n=1 Tax=Anisodus tanguticus TaxID=243964 RepID=A0AAE1VEG8_9SOLA|nr:hypothetical protein RND71_019578 [Anisodus tanguticus]